MVCFPPTDPQLKTSLSHNRLSTIINTRGKTAAVKIFEYVHHDDVIGTATSTGSLLMVEP